MATLSALNLMKIWRLRGFCTWIWLTGTFGHLNYLHNEICAPFKQRNSQALNAIRYYPWWIIRSCWFWLRLTIFFKLVLRLWIMNANCWRNILIVQFVFCFLNALSRKCPLCGEPHSRILHSWRSVEGGGAQHIQNNNFGPLWCFHPNACFWPNLG